MSQTQEGSWEKHYSKSKQRDYWFNAATGESKWYDPNATTSISQNKSYKRTLGDDDPTNSNSKIITPINSSSSSSSSKIFKRVLLYKDHTKLSDDNDNNDNMIKGNVISDKRNFFFSNLPESLRSNILLDEEAMYSITNNRDADKMTNIIIATLKKYVSKPNFIITDGTACVGGNTISFARHELFELVNTVEIDNIRFNMLCKNLQICGLSQAKVKCYHGDYIQGLHELQQDCVFVDPPWGGPDMMSLKKVTFPLGNLSLFDLCLKLKQMKLCKLIALKVSPNYDIDEFQKLELGNNSNISVCREFRKMILILIHI